MARKLIMAQQFGDRERGVGQHIPAGVQAELHRDEGDCPLFAVTTSRNYGTPWFKKGTVPSLISDQRPKN